VNASDVAVQVHAIGQMGLHDAENAHIMEDNLHGDVLQAIASGSQDAAELASAALETLKFRHDRWCG